MLWTVPGMMAEVLKLVRHLLLLAVLPAMAACQTTEQAKDTAKPPVVAEPVKSAEAEPAETVAVESSDDIAKADAEEQVVEQAAVAAPTSPDAELVFLDFAGFDEDLSRAMAKDAATIQVDVPAAFNLNDVPERLGKWFSRIDGTGGYVQARKAARSDAEATRGIVGALIDIAVAAYEAQEAEELLAPAAGYNALIEYDEQSGDAHQVIFYRR